MNGSVLKLALIVAFLSTGCETIKVQSDVPCPSRPVIQVFTGEELDAMPDTAIKKAASNQIRLKAYAEKLEVRANCD